MPTPYRIAIIATCSLLLTVQASAFARWNDLRHSAELPSGQFTVRVEAPTAGAVNEILYAAGGIQAVIMVPVADGPSTVQADVPAPGAAPRHYGFRLEHGGDIDLLPVRLADGAAPDPADLTLLNTDPQGDEAFGRDHLDITGYRISRDGTHLHAALSNVSGGFPVSSGFTFFSYLAAFTDPAVADPETVFAMIHTVTAAGIIEPGLYQINGTGVDDLVKIGEITVTEYAAQNTLVLSCDLADLESNTAFQSWYDPADPRVGTAGFSQKITILGGTEEADNTIGGTWHLRSVALGPLTSDLPALSALDIPQPGSGEGVATSYTDAGGHCPVVAELDIDGVIYPLTPQSLDYTSPVTYHSQPGLPPIENDTWTSIIARFSDNLVDLVEVEEMVVGVTTTAASLRMRAVPNPFVGTTQFSFNLPREQSVQLDVFDLHGRRVASLVNGSLPAGPHGRTWNGRDTTGRIQPSGVYVYRLRTEHQTAVQRVTLVR